MTSRNTCIQVLHDIEMYGGDTTPWRLYLKHDGGGNYTFDEIDGYDATLTILPYYMNTGVSISGTPVVTKSGTFVDMDGDAAVEFSLYESDTKTLAGKHIYQIEIANGSDKRIGQGGLYIHANIDQ